MKYIESIIDRQVRQWELQRQEKRGTQTLTEICAPIITISRTPGAEGEEIASLLSARTGYHLFDRELIQVIANDVGVQTRIIEMLDEKARSEYEMWFDGMLRGRIVDNSDYIRSLTRALGAIAKHGNAIIMGRGANIIIGPEHGLHVRITASHATWVGRIAERNNISKDKAEAIVKKIHNERREFMKRLFGVDLDRAENYDLTINTDYISDPDAVEIIMLACLKKKAQLQK